MTNLKTVEHFCVGGWTPSEFPDPTPSQMQALYLEFVNEFLTVETWGRAHHMDSETARVFLPLCRKIHEARCDAIKALVTNKNPWL